VSHEEVLSVLPGAKEAFWIHVEFHKQPNPVQSHDVAKKSSPILPCSPLTLTVSFTRTRFPVYHLYDPVVSDYTHTNTKYWKGTSLPIDVLFGQHYFRPLKAY